VVLVQLFHDELVMVVGGSYGQSAGDGVGDEARDERALSVNKCCCCWCCCYLWHGAHHWRGRATGAGGRRRRYDQTPGQLAADSEALAALLGSNLGGCRSAEPVTLMSCWVVTRLPERSRRAEVEVTVLLMVSS